MKKIANRLVKKGVMFLCISFIQHYEYSMTEKSLFGIMKPEVKLYGQDLLF